MKIIYTKLKAGASWVYKFLKLDDLEFWLFKKLLKRYVTYEMDQWSRWKFKTKYGEVYVDISRQNDGNNYDDLKV